MIPPRDVGRDRASACVLGNRPAAAVRRLCAVRVTCVASRWWGSPQTVASAANGPCPWEGAAAVTQRSEARDVRESPFAPARRRALPRIHPRIVAAIAVGGFAGGLLRYAVSLALPAGPGGFPWAVVAVNTGGAFLLGLVLILVLEVLPPTTYL